MKLSQFKISVPDSLIATHPAKNREDARLMVLDRKTGKIEHKHFKDILSYFNEGDVMVVNNTRVFPARLYGNKEKTGAKIEVFLLRELNRDSRLWDVLVDPARKIRIGNKLYFGDDDLLVAEVIDNTTSRGRTLRFLFDGPYEEFKKTITILGNTPLPKYIKRKAEPEAAIGLQIADVNRQNEEFRRSYQERYQYHLNNTKKEIALEQAAKNRVNTPNVPVAPTP